MASVYNRGTRDNPVWYARVKHLDGKWKSEPTGEDSKVLARRWADKRQQEIDDGKPDPRHAPKCDELLKTWRESITNRNAADDRTRIDRHLVPFFGPMRITTVSQDVILEWITKQRATPKARGKGNLSDASVRHHLNLLSRFLSWCTPKYIPLNPVKNIEKGKRPKQSRKLADAPWIEDDKMVRNLFGALPSPFNLMFYIGNRSGMRLGEICGLRLSSFDTMDEGTILVRYTYDDGFLKEDKDCTGKSKPVPASDDLPALLKPWIDRRKAEGATGESLMFPNPRNDGKAYRKLALERAWKRSCSDLGLMKPDPKDPGRQVALCTWYEGTRHSFASRVLKQTRGRALYEVSKALGHHDVSVTAKHYARWIMDTFSTALRGGLGLGADQQAEVIHLPQKSIG